MANKKSINFLPGVFQTDANKKFLSATLDQLISEPNLTNINGYIGRQFSPTYKVNDSYIIEDTEVRQQYQLEPSIVVKNDSDEITFFTSYEDFLNQIKHYGGIIENQDRLFENEHYSFNPQISLDAFVNFSQYYWLPTGPNPVDVNTTGVDFVKTFTVSRNDNVHRYDFTSGGANNNTITLARGGTYTFSVNQPGFKFWIQTEPGTDGLINATPTISTREILGVENNGTDVGDITFTVPQSTAQNRYLSMTTVYNVDYATPLRYADIQNRTASEFLAQYPEYSGVGGSLDGLTLVFVDQNLLTNAGEEAWTVPTVNDNGSNVLGYDEGDIIDQSLRHGVWKVQYISAGLTEPIIRLVPVIDINLDEKVYIKYGNTDANREFFKEYDTLLHRVPVITSVQDTLYFQDGTDSRIYGSIKLVDSLGWNIDVDNDILGMPTYTSPNGVKFTNGLKVSFSTDVTPATYQNKEYYVEGVGTSIRLVDVSLLISPEEYNDENRINYPTQKLTLSKPTVEIIPSGSTLTIGTKTIVNLNEVTVGQYTIDTISSVEGITPLSTITGTGIAPGSVITNIVPVNVFPEYITINRGSIDLNPWSRNNCWFHRDIITLTAAYNNVTPVIDQSLRAQRPIVQFNSDLQLVNFGRIGKKAVDILDLSTVDAFQELEGKTYDTAFGVTLIDGMRVLFANDNDPLVKDKIYELNLVQYNLDDQGLPTGDIHIKLTIAEDGNNEEWDTVCVADGGYKGTSWWYNGTDWIESQQKTQLQQAPLFDAFDQNGYSLTSYLRSTFTGTNIFGYKQNTSGVNDPVLGFPLSYRNFGTQGDIEFQNFYESDTFSYVLEQIQYVRDISVGALRKINSRDDVTPINIWNKVVESSKQYQLITFEYDGNTSTYDMLITPRESESIPNLKVYQNNKFLTEDNWVLTGTSVTINAELANNDKIDILVYSNETSPIGYYEIPLNLGLNAQNIDIDALTLGQLRNHLVELSLNSTELNGNVLGTSNLRDVEIGYQGGNILKHSSPVPLAAMFLVDEQVNFINSLRYAQQEYTRFRNKFLEASSTMTGIDPNDPINNVTIILQALKVIKNQTFPWYYSDMVPYNTLNNVIDYNIFNPLVRTYEISNVFDDTALSNTSVLVYLNGVQLTKGKDYVFETVRPAITITSEVTLLVDDTLRFVEYDNTDGNYIPETPTKLGLYPKFEPRIFVDDSYREPVTVIRGHDGSITPAFNDYRDQTLLELELRIYNNLKIENDGTYPDIFSALPGKFREDDYSINEFNQIISGQFQNWVGNNKLDFTSNNTFKSNDAFTWNYTNFPDRIDGETLPGSWRSCYYYVYGTIRPHLMPWEMLGFSFRPSWWESYYGPAPYTGGNNIMWDDLEAGLIREGRRAGVDKTYARPGLTSYIPVNENGDLLSPAGILAAAYNATQTANSWTAGDLGPVEMAWRNSPEYPFAVQQALALMKPAQYFGINANTSKYFKNQEIGQYLTSDLLHHIKQSDIKFNGQVEDGEMYRTSGYMNWIADYLISQGVNPDTKITPMLRNYKVNLSYKLAGFTDQKYIQVLAEQSSPSSTNDSIILPNENYEVYLHKSAPVDRLAYSSVIVEKTSQGYSIRGYDLANPFFTIIPSIVNGKSYKITVLNSEATVFYDYQPIKLTVPYGYEFKSKQQVADFLVSYERYLMSQGFVFTDMDEDLAEVRNWKLSIKEFLHWSQQGWKEGSILVLSPVADSISIVSTGSITDAITDSQYGSKVIDQNYKLVKNNNYDVVRTPTDFKITITDANSVFGYFEVNLVQYEHVLIFDNVTVFDDIVYKPELGNRQYRLKLIGQKTGEWDGSLTAPGFIYSSGDVPAWLPGKDYLKGDIVQYKTQYYTALNNVIASSEFIFDDWRTVGNSEIQKGLFPNFSSIAVKPQSYYDSYGYFNDADQVKYSHGLIGFKPRQYLDDLGLNETSQIEFYKGYIKQKGSANAVNQLSNAEFNNLSSRINYYEEWAVRTGEYGAIDINPFVEIALDEKAFSVNPATVEFVNEENNNRGNGTTVFNKNQLYRSTDEYNGSIALTRDDYSNVDNDIPTAGYVNIDDVDTTIFDLENFTELNNQLDEIGSGYTIWTARDFTQKWNVYRVSESDNQVVRIENALDSYITFDTIYPHNLEVNDIFLLRNFDPAFDGFYKVYKVVNNNTVMVEYNEDTSELSEIDSEGVLFTLDSLRFQYMEDARNYVPPHGWKENEKIWIDIDAPTSIEQGQLLDTENNTWKVYEKTMPWDVKQGLAKSLTETTVNDRYGQGVKMSSDSSLVLVSSPKFDSNIGIVNSFVRNYLGEYVASFPISPDAANVSAFGTSVDLSFETVMIGAPDSSDETGYVFVYNRPTSTTVFNRQQVLVGSAPGDKFGTTIASDEHGEWIYVSAPGSDSVHVYGLNKFVENKTVVMPADGMSANIILPFTPAINDVNSLQITSSVKTYVPGIDYTLDYGNVTLNFSEDLPLSDIQIIQGPYYTLVDTISANAGSDFGYDIVSSDDGTQLVITAPSEHVLVGNVMSSANVEINKAYTITSVGTSNFELAGASSNTIGVVFVSNVSGIAGTGLVVETEVNAGAIHVYDRQVEAFIATGAHEYVTKANIGSVRKVTIDNTEITNYYVIGSNTIRFVDAPLAGKLFYVETNKFNLLESVTGSSPQTAARFGSSVDICRDTCAIYVGAPHYDANSIYNTGAVFKFHNRGRLYGTTTGLVKDPTFTVGDTIRLDNFEVTVTTPGVGETSLDSFVADVNEASLLGITASNENGYLKLVTVQTKARDFLRILQGIIQPGSNGILADAGINVFAEMQLIVNPYNAPGEYFGSKVRLSPNAYKLVISSDRGTTREYTTFDDGLLVLDHTTTGIFDVVKGSGSVYVYELYDDPRDSVEKPGRYAFAQQLNPGNLDPNDEFGADIDIVGNFIVASATGDDANALDAGAVYIFENETKQRGWKLIRYQEPKVDLDSVNRIYLYNKESNTILTNMEFIDPAKGKILGLAEQEITYKTAFDPAFYNRGDSERVNVSTELYWNDSHAEQVWWNLDKVRYIDYEQGTLTYRSSNWGRVFPGSEIEILEWVESSVLPSQYVESGFNGNPKYPDDSAYVEISFVDQATGIISSKYFFWVKNKTSINLNNSARKMPIQTVQELIENPKGQGLAYAAITHPSSVLVYNVGEYLSDSDTIMHLDYEVQHNESIIHSEYQLLQKGNADSIIPAKISAKLIDSLSGIDADGSVVPDPKLSIADRFGTSFRPRQSMFVDRLAAMSDLVSYVNAIFEQQAIAREYDLTQFYAEEEKPNFKLGEYNLAIATDQELLYIETASLSTGYRVLVENDTTQDGLWVLYQWTDAHTWDILRVQSFKTSLYWDNVDWYADGFSGDSPLDYVVDTLVDALKLPVEVGNEVLVKVDSFDQGWNLLTVNEDKEFEVVGIQRGTVKLKESLGDFENFELGFGNQGFGTSRYDQSPNIEIRYLIAGLRDDIFIKELESEFNNLFFVLVNYLFGEQAYVDWLFKTSFVSVTHFLRNLEQYPNYVKDNQTYYQDYINEIKPYSTKIREYLINYNGNDKFDGSVTDFDLAPYYDRGNKIFRSPSGEQVAKDEQLWATGYLGDTLINEDYKQWYANRDHIVDSIVIQNAGSGYTTEPIVTILAADTTGSGATARAVIDYDTGEVTDIIVINSGSGYTLTPTVVINGSNQVEASAYANLNNNRVRSINTTIKFDRISYLSTVVNWTANTAYTEGQIISYNGVGYVVLANVTSSSTFVIDNYEIYPSSNFDNANDRITAYYKPLSGMPAKDLRQLIYGIDYPGVQVQGADYLMEPGFGNTYDITIFDNVQYNEDGSPVLDDNTVDTIIRSNYSDLALGARPEDINITGGAYVDEFSSHAPEELVPGIVFDTLSMKVYTSINGNVDVIGYRVFNDMLHSTTHLRIADSTSTTLAQPLTRSDTEIVVDDASVLSTPNPELAVPGVIFIDGERITYYTIDVGSNTLGQIRRGTYGTGVPEEHAIGSVVMDSSVGRHVPPTTYANVTMLDNEIWYNAGVDHVTDESGMTGSTTESTLFLKAQTANAVSAL